jgi:hypothetical protein
MDPFTLAFAGGAIVSGISSIFGAGDAKKQAQISQQVAGIEGQQNQVRRQAMEISSQRQQTENIRNAQLARSMSLNSATQQGAQFGSGYAGGQAQISGDANYNALGISQNLMAGEKMFNYDDQISRLKAQSADVQGDQAMWQGIGQFGNSIMGAAGKFGNLMGGPQGFGNTTGGIGLPTYGEAINTIGRGGLY